MFIAETVTQEQKEYRWKNTVKAVVATRQMLKLSLLGTGGLKVTCKDCIHYEACHDMYYEEHATRHFDPEKHNAEKDEIKRTHSKQRTTRKDKTISDTTTEKEKKKWTTTH